MPRGKAANGESKSAIFRRIYESNLPLLKVPGYDELFRIYQSEDSSRPVGQSERQVAANVKSRLRKDHKVRGGRRGGKRRKGMAAVASTVAPATPAQRSSASHLALEDAIDDCIYHARRMDPARFEDVVKLLKRARNQLIVMTSAK